MRTRDLTKLILWTFLLVGGVVLLLFLCRPFMPDTPTPTVMPSTVTNTSTHTPTTRPPAHTPTSTPTRRPSETPRPSVTPLLIVTPTAVPPTATPVPVLRGVHRVQPGDTLWGVACQWYSDTPLRPGANPLTPCTCWPGIYRLTSQVNPPQLIFPGERYAIPLMCGQ